MHYVKINEIFPLIEYGGFKKNMMMDLLIFQHSYS